ncbi:hypothetical protein BT69DRAFT_137567 [Atractiella rhizophila]|nr:hypothetical protein BT69DRAFT_137567 [Atractiella rhizophila]
MRLTCGGFPLMTDRLYDKYFRNNEARYDWRFYVDPFPFFIQPAVCQPTDTDNFWLLMCVVLEGVLRTMAVARASLSGLDGQSTTVLNLRLVQLFDSLRQWRRLHFYAHFEFVDARNYSLCRISLDNSPEPADMTYMYTSYAAQYGFLLYQTIIESATRFPTNTILQGLLAASTSLVNEQIREIISFVSFSLLAKRLGMSSMWEYPFWPSQVLQQLNLLPDEFSALVIFLQQNPTFYAPMLAILSEMKFMSWKGRAMADLTDVVEAALQEVQPSQETSQNSSPSQQSDVPSSPEPEEALSPWITEFIGGLM